MLAISLIAAAYLQDDHLLAGHDHLANTPRQLMILQALAMRMPKYGHLSLITGDDGAKLSKRHGSFSLHDLRREGYLAHAVLNYLSRLSHTYEQQKLMSFSELANNFKLEKLSKASARFDKNQLLHWQKEAVMVLDNAATLAWIGSDIVNHVPADKLDLFAEVMRHNILFPEDAQKWANILFGDDSKVFLASKIDLLKEAGEPFFTTAKDAVKIHGVDLKSVCEDLKIKLNIAGKKLFMPLRIALTGEENGPELVQIAKLLGQDEMQNRFDLVLKLMRNEHAKHL